MIFDEILVSQLIIFAILKYTKYKATAAAGVPGARYVPGSSLVLPEVFWYALVCFGRFLGIVARFILGFARFCSVLVDSSWGVVSIS